MSKQDLLKTETFYPSGEQEFVNESPQASLSSTGRLLTYNEQLKASLDNGINFTQILDVLIKTKDTNELLQAATKLVNYQLDTAYLVYLQKYSLSDFYLIFINRLLELHQNEKVSLLASEINNELYHEYPTIQSKGYFTFTQVKEHATGAYYTDKATQEKIFYLDFEKKLFRFNSQALTNLFIVEYRHDYDYVQLKEVTALLLALGRYLKEDYGFDVDFNLLDPANNAFYEITQTSLPQEALDKLFVQAAQAGFMLVNGMDNEAILDLGNVTISIYRLANQDVVEKWGINVSDPKQEISWLDILFKYEFLRDWYLENLGSLEIVSDPRYF